MGSPEKPLDVEMGDMSEEAKLNPADVEVKTDQGLLKEEEKEPRFTGLKKEELLEISNQPKWVRARWALFIVFWLVWLAMLIGAILIVVNAPRCKPEPVPEWYQDTVAYEANVEEFAEGFEAMKDHLPYVESLHAKSLVVTGAAKESDAAAVMGDEANLTSLIDAAHKKEMKVMVDVVIDTVSTSSSVFRNSSAATCSGQGSGDCGVLFWRSTTANMDRNWVHDATRGESYKIDPDAKPVRAVLDYSNPRAMEYINGVLTSWFARGIDGIQIRDIGKMAKATRASFVQSVWDQFFVNNGSAKALYVYSSDPDASLNPVPLTVNQTNTARAPVFLNAEVASRTGSSSGKFIQDAVMKWRNQSRNIGGFVASPLDVDLATTRLNNTNLAAALHILTMALPGVPILRSGDELAATSPIFTWDSRDFRDSVPLNGSSDVLKQTKELTVRRVQGIQALHSLRFDSRNADTKFDFLETGNDDVVAFRRQWDVKPPVLVVSNLSPTDHTVNVAVKNGLEKDGSLAEEATLLVSSTSLSTDKKIKLKELALPSGTTLILK